MGYTWRHYKMKLLVECSPKRTFSSPRRVPANKRHEAKEIVLLFEQLPHARHFICLTSKTSTVLQSWYTYHHFRDRKTEILKASNWWRNKYNPH